MKKLALLLCGLGSLAVVSVSAANYPTSQTEPQYQEQCAPVTCSSDTCVNQLPCNQPVPCDVPENAQTTGAVPCNQTPCATDTVCAPAVAPVAYCGGC